MIKKELNDVKIIKQSFEQKYKETNIDLDK